MASSSADCVLLLGPLQVIRSGAQLPLPPSRKVRALLAYLAIAPRPVTREKLCDLFWDVADDPRRELRWCLSKLRPLVDAPATTRLVADHAQVRIDTNSLDIDAVVVADRAQMTLTGGSPDDLQSLRALFRGDFLEGLFVDRAPLFDNWVAGQRHRFGQFKRQLLERLSFVLPPESDDRIEVLRECIEVSPFDAAAHIELVRALRCRKAGLQRCRVKAFALKARYRRIDLMLGFCMKRVAKQRANELNMGRCVERRNFDALAQYFNTVIALRWQDEAESLE